MRSWIRVWRISEIIRVNIPVFSSPLWKSMLMNDTISKRLETVFCHQLLQSQLNWKPTACTGNLRGHRWRGSLHILCCLLFHSSLDTYVEQIAIRLPPRLLWSGRTALYHPPFDKILSRREKSKRPQSDHILNWRHANRSARERPMAYK